VVSQFIKAAMSWCPREYPNDNDFINDEPITTMFKARKDGRVMGRKARETWKDALIKALENDTEINWVSDSVIILMCC